MAWMVTSKVAPRLVHDSALGAANLVILVLRPFVPKGVELDHVLRTKKALD